MPVPSNFLSPEQSPEVAPLTDIESELEQMKVDDNFDELFDFQRVLPRLKRLVKDWDYEQKQTMLRRRQRMLDVDVEALRVEGKLKADETFIPRRVIDTNIKREQPELVGFITQSRRLAIFECRDNPDVNVDSIEKDFTRGLTYVNWESPFFSVIDGSQLHGWDAIEIEYDDSKPLKVNFDDCGHDKLIFSLKSKDLQSNEIILREFEISTLKLKDFVRKFGFDPVQAKKLLDKYKNQTDENKLNTIKIYKKFCKYDGDVYVSWFCDSECDDWLKAPTKLWRGRTRKVTKTELQDVPTGEIDMFTGQPATIQAPVPVEIEEEIYESLYPIRLLRYQKTEEKEIAETKGRGWLDLPNQEGQTCLMTNFVNASCRSSNVYGSPKHPQGTGSVPKRLDLDLEPGCVYSEPIELWSPPSPSFDLIRGAQALDTQSQVETGNIATATLNSKDSRKTAEELKMAGQEKQRIVSVQTTLLSTFMREVMIDAWSIVQSLALSGKIKFALIPNEAAAVDPSQPAYINDFGKIKLDYDLKAAGDKDVIERNENIQKMQNAWPVISTTAAAPVFLVDMLREMFPKDSKKYEAAIMQAMQQQQQVPMLMQVIEASANDGRAILPEEVQQLKQALGASQQTQQPQTT
jgi:hypothetical protein